MSVALSAAAASASALSYATAGVLQHSAARQAPAGTGLQLGLMVSLLRRPLWLAGIAADAIALALHAAALSGGQLAVVQPLLVSGLLFALPASALIEHRRPSLAEWAWAAVLIAALAAFLLSAKPTAGRNLSDTDVLAVLTACGVAATIPLLAAAHYRPRHKALLLGVIAGIAYGITAALIKDTIGLLTGPHPTQAFTSWPLYLLLGVGGSALVISQSAFQAGPLAASLPPLTITDPVVAVIIGITVFHEQIRNSGAAIAVQLGAAIVMSVATVQMARRTTNPTLPAHPS